MEKKIEDMKLRELLTEKGMPLDDFSSHVADLIKQYSEASEVSFEKDDDGNIRIFIIEVEEEDEESEYVTRKYSDPK